MKLVLTIAPYAARARMRNQTSLWKLVGVASGMAYSAKRLRQLILYLSPVSQLVHFHTSKLIALCIYSSKMF